MKNDFTVYYEVKLGRLRIEGTRMTGGYFKTQVQLKRTREQPKTRWMEAIKEERTMRAREIN